MTYLDHAATTPLRPEAAAAMAPYLAGEFGNPSGTHAFSRRARNTLEEARERVAAALGVARPRDVVFTSGGTEADNLALAGVALAGGGRGGVVTTAVEHAAVLETAYHLRALGCPVGVVGVEAAGTVDPSRVAAAVDGDTALVSVMAANNETGVIQPVAEVSALLAGRPVVVHCDAVQAVAALPVSLDELGVDLLTVSAHKLGGPAGVGVLAMRPGIELAPVLHGGGQELGRRSGTPNLMGIVGAVAALEAAVIDRKRFAADTAEARLRFETRLSASVPEVVFTAGGVASLPHISHLRVPGVDAETLLIRLDALGVAASAGSACHSGAIAPSHVLIAMGMPEREAEECVRFSFGWDSTPGDGEPAADLVAAAIGGMRR